MKHFRVLVYTLAFLTVFFSASPVQAVENISVPCEGKTNNQCVFDTRLQVKVGNNYVESVTAYGKGWNWDPGKDNTSIPWPNNAFDLTSIEKYRNGPCAGKTPGTCQFDTRGQFNLNGNLVESITAYGKGWN